MISWNRLLSSILAVSYVIAAISTGSAKIMALTCFGVVLMIAWIWFPEMSDQIHLMQRPAHASTPAWMLLAAGWIVFVAPLFLWLYMCFFGER